MLTTSIPAGALVCTRKARAPGHRAREVDEGGDRVLRQRSSSRRELRSSTATLVKRGGSKATPSPTPRISSGTTPRHRVRTVERHRRPAEDHERRRSARCGRSWRGGSGGLGLRASAGDGAPTPEARERAEAAPPRPRTSPASRRGPARPSRAPRSRTPPARRSCRSDPAPRGGGVPSSASLAAAALSVASGRITPARAKPVVPDDDRAVVQRRGRGEDRLDERGREPSLDRRARRSGARRPSRGAG